MVRPPLQRKESRILKLPAESQKKMMFNVLSALDEMHQGKQAPPSPHHLYKRSTHSLLWYDAHLSMAVECMNLLGLISRSLPLSTAGIYHRDISGWNIMGNFDCSFKVIDLGMASHVAAIKASGFRRYGSHRCGMIIGQNNTVNVARETRECSSAVGMLTGPSRGGSSITHSGGSRSNLQMAEDPPFI